MLLRGILICTLVAVAAWAPAQTRLLMLEQSGCEWCARWNAEVGAIYAKTDEGRRAPLVRRGISDALPEDVTLGRRARYTPTFVLFSDGAEVDRFGVPQVVIRDRFAGPHTVDTASAKAWTAVSFRTSTLELDRGIEEGTLSRGLRDVPGALALGGGLPVQSAGSTVGGVGVSGAPGPDLDEDCARAGIDAISLQSEF